MCSKTIKQLLDYQYGGYPITRTEVVSCHVCVIADSLNQRKCVPLAQTQIQLFVVPKPAFTPVHSSSWVSLGPLTKHCIPHVCRLRRPVWRMLGLYVVSFFWTRFRVRRSQLGEDQKSFSDMLLEVLMGKNCGSFRIAKFESSLAPVLFKWPVSRYQ